MGLVRCSKCGGWCRTNVPHECLGANLMTEPTPLTVDEIEAAIQWATSWQRNNYYTELQTASYLRLLNQLLSVMAENADLRRQLEEARSTAFDEAIKVVYRFDGGRDIASAIRELEAKHGTR